MNDLRLHEAKEDNLKSIFRSISAALSVRNKASKKMNISFGHHHPKSHTKMKRNESEKKYCHSRLCLAKIQLEDKQK